jgi:hypothetical protein
MVRRKLSRRFRNVTEGGGKATRKNYLTAPRSKGCEDCENDSCADRRRTDRQLVFGIQTGSLVCTCEAAILLKASAISRKRMRYFRLAGGGVFRFCSLRSNRISLPTSIPLLNAA